MNKEEILNQLNNAATKEEALEIIKQNNLSISEDKVDSYFDDKSLSDEALNNINGGFMTRFSDSGDTPKFQVGDRVDIYMTRDDDAKVTFVYPTKGSDGYSTIFGWQFRYEVRYRDWAGDWKESMFYEYELTKRNN